MIAPVRVLKEKTGKSEKIKEAIFFCVCILFWFISWFMMNAVLRGYLRMRATLYFGRFCEGIYIIFGKKTAIERPSKPDNPFSDFSNLDHKEVHLDFKDTSDKLFASED